MKIRHLISLPTLLCLLLPFVSEAGSCKAPPPCTSQTCNRIELDPNCFDPIPSSKPTHNVEGTGGIREDGIAAYKIKDVATDSIYRIYTISKTKNQPMLGSWWSLTRPTDRDTYQRLNAICPEWNPEMNMIVACPLSAFRDMTIDVGFTQSVDSKNCSSTTFKATNEIQVRLFDASTSPNASQCRSSAMNWK